MAWSLIAWVLMAELAFTTVGFFGTALLLMGLDPIRKAPTAAASGFSGHGGSSHSPMG